MMRLVTSDWSYRRALSFVAFYRMQQTEGLKSKSAKDRSWNQLQKVSISSYCQEEK